MLYRNDVFVLVLVNVNENVVMVNVNDVVIELEVEFETENGNGNGQQLEMVYGNHEVECESLTFEVCKRVRMERKKRGKCGNGGEDRRDGWVMDVNVR